MSLSYGNFSHILNASVTSGVIPSGTVVYFTLPWYPASYIENVRIQVQSGTAPATYSELAIVSNGAHERNGDFTSADTFHYIDTTSKTASSTGNSFAIWNISNPLYVENVYSRPYLHIKLTTATQTNSTYKLNVQGRKAIPSTYLYNDVTGIKKLKDWRVLVAGSGGTIDCTDQARSNSSNTNNSFAISASTDYIYIGSEQKVDHWDLGIGTASTNAGPMTGQLWNGSAWSSFTVLDNTAATAVSSLRYSGVVEGYGIGSSTWEKYKLPTDPLTVYENKIVAGTERVTGLYNPARYWVRLSVGSIGDSAKFKYVLPVEDGY